jgi:outer membrane protein OmpA-like peptidoglycan-associated protein
VRPPLASPFTWTATKADGKVSIEGYTPDGATQSRLADAAGRGSSDGTTIADGAPAGFLESATAGLKVLALLESGAVSYDGSTWTITGTASTPQQAFEADTEFRAAALKAAGWTMNVKLPTAPAVEAPPQVASYTWTVEKLPAGTIALSGFVSNAGLQRYLLAHAGPKAVDTSKLGSGAPDGFVPATIAAIDALLALDEGKVSYSDGTWSLTGRSADHRVPDAVRSALANAVDAANWKIAIDAPTPPAPVADPYVWSATKAADGSYALAGNLPNDGFRRFVAAHVGKVSSDTTAIASGQPGPFTADVLAALDALDQLVEGSASFDGATWSLSGTPQTTADGDGALASLSSAGTKAADWRTAIGAPLTVPAPPTAGPGDALPMPEPLAVPALTTQTPAQAETAVAAVETPQTATTPAAPSAPLSLSFNATLAEGQPVSLSGVVPAEPARRWFGMIAGDAPTDALRVASNLPSDFIPNADAGLRALMQLSAGTLAWDGSSWSLSGMADTEATRKTVLASLPATPEWSTDVALTPPIDLCRREVVAFEESSKILFQSGRARMTDESVASLVKLAGFLNDCPDVTVEVEGHTDADGPDDLNLALSVSRAEAVVDSLIANGVAPERLYAVGYGESMPIASNDTAAGKQANRRIVFTLVEPR